MSVPGQNNLALALQLIGPQTVSFYRYAGRTTNAAGVYMSTFADARELTQTSVQPVPATKYEALGLDRTKRHVQLWAMTDMYGTARARAPDEFVWNGERYQVTQETGWFPQDGWSMVVAVEVGGNAAH